MSFARVAALVALLGAAAAVGLVLRGDDGTHAPRVPRADRPAERPPGDREAIAAALDRRAEAISRGPRARRIGVRALRLDAGRLRVSGERASADVEVVYGLRGVRGRFTAGRRMTLERSGRRWRVVRTSGRRRRPPWEVASFRRESSPHFVVLAPPGVDPAAGGLLAALEAGYEQMRTIIREGELRRRYLVVVAADGDQAHALTAGIRGVGSLAALTDTEVREDGPARRVVRVLGQRLVVVWPQFASADPQQGATVVIHELTHAVMAPVTSGRTPAWLTEGLALYVSDDRRVLQAAGSPLSLARLTHPAAVARLDGEAQSAAYALSSAAAFYIAERWGREALIELHEAFNDPGVEGQREAVRRVLRVPFARLESELRGWISAQAL